MLFAAAICPIFHRSQTSGIPHPRRGFDYLGTYKSYVSYGAEGFYPGDPISGALRRLMTKGDLQTPIWFNEFTAGGGGYYGEPGRSRMYAYLALVMGAQGILAWTFNSHLGGEEQALFGLLDHDSTPSWKVDEFARIASDYKLLSKFGFPRYTHPEVAIAYSFDSFVDSIRRSLRNDASVLQDRPMKNRCRALLIRSSGITSTQPSLTLGRIVSRLQAGGSARRLCDGCPPARRLFGSM